MPAGDDIDDNQFADDTRKSLSEIATTEAGRKMLLEQAAALAGPPDPVPGPSTVNVDQLVAGITKAVTATFEAQAAAVQAAVKKGKKRDAVTSDEDDDDKSDSNKRQKEDPIPSPFSRPFGKGAYSKDDDILFTSDGNTLNHFSSECHSGGNIRNL